MAITDQEKRQYYTLLGEDGVFQDIKGWVEEDYLELYKTKTYKVTPLPYSLVLIELVMHHLETKAYKEGTTKQRMGLYTTEGEYNRWLVEIGNNYGGDNDMLTNQEEDFIEFYLYMIHKIAKRFMVNDYTRVYPYDYKQHLIGYYTYTVSSLRTNWVCNYVGKTEESMVIQIKKQLLNTKIEASKGATKEHLRHINKRYQFLYGLIPSGENKG